MALYCGITKIHRVDKDIARSAVMRHHMTRKELLELVERVFGKSLPKATEQLLVEAQKIRDRVMHGKDASEAEMRKAIADLILYATDFNEFCFDVAGFRPCGRLQGYAGARQPLDKSTSRWVVKGLGLPA